MKSSDAELSIGELAGPFGIAPHVLRHWESMGVLIPARRVGNRRRYTPEQRIQVALILRGQEAGISLEHMREITTAPDGAARRQRLKEHLAELEVRIARLTTARDAVDRVLHCPWEDFLACPRLRAALEEPSCTGEGDAAPLTSPIPHCGDCA
jgi:MerR family transcriptional regulator, copper efflux regulator